MYLYCTLKPYKRSREFNRGLTTLQQSPEQSCRLSFVEAGSQQTQELQRHCLSKLEKCKNPNRGTPNSEKALLKLKLLKTKLCSFRKKDTFSVGFFCFVFFTRQPKWLLKPATVKSWQFTTSKLLLRMQTRLLCDYAHGFTLGPSLFCSV